MRVRGVNSTAEAIRAGVVNKIYVDERAKSKRIESIIKQAKKLGIPVIFGRFEDKIEADVSPIKYKDLEFVAKKTIREGSFL